MKKQPIIIATVLLAGLLGFSGDVDSAGSAVFAGSFSRLSVSSSIVLMTPRNASSLSLHPAHAFEAAVFA